MKRFVLMATMVLPATAALAAPARTGVATTRCVIPPQSNQYACLGPGQIGQAQQWMHWMIDPTAVVGQNTSLRLKGMLVEFHSGHAGDIALAYGATRYYTSTVRHIPSHPNFVDVGEVGTTGFPVGIRIVAQPNGTLFVEAGMTRPRFGFSIVTNEPRAVANRMAHAIWRAASRR